MRTVFEVGVNDGRDTLGLLTPDTILYGFEPTVELYKLLQLRFKDHDNIKLIPLAVDIENRFTHFNVAGWQDWGCSSLNDFSEEVKGKWKVTETSGKTYDFHFTDKQKVMTIRLDDFCRMYNINTIDYLHVDAQGSDFNVLKSLGSYIDVVKEGKVEVAYNVPLYAKIDNSFNSVAEWLTDQGFQIDVEYDHPVNKTEANIHFKRF